MPCKLTVITKKPAGTKFYAEQHDVAGEQVKSLHNTIREMPGNISYEMEVVDEDTRKFTIVFDTVENYANYLEQRTTLPGWAERHEYNVANGIVSENSEEIT